MEDVPLPCQRQFSVAVALSCWLGGTLVLLPLSCQGQVSINISAQRRCVQFCYLFHANEKFSYKEGWKFSLVTTAMPTTVYHCYLCPAGDNSAFYFYIIPKKVQPCYLSRLVNLRSVSILWCTDKRANYQWQNESPILIGNWKYFYVLISIYFSRFFSEVEQCSTMKESYRLPMS